MEIRNVEMFKVEGPLKDGSLKLHITVDPHDAEAIGALLVLGAKGIPIDIRVKEAKDYGWK
jgi:hypothetical protein